jgi:hypothetical protein
VAVIITTTDLASWLRDSTLQGDESLLQIVDLTNDLITEAWTDPTTPTPVRVTMLALSVAARAWVNSPVTANLESTSVSVDDGSTTRRFRNPSRVGVYLTDDETALLNGEQRTRSVRLIKDGVV